MSPLSMTGALVGDHMCYGSTNISSACDDASYQLGQRGTPSDPYYCSLIRMYLQLKCV
jgi:hypothetical protein